MSLSACIIGLVEEGRISKGQAAEAERLYTRHFNALKNDMGMSAAATLASERAVAVMGAQIKRRRLLAGLQVQVRQQIEADLARYGGGSAGGPIDPRAGPAFLSGDDRAPYSNVEGRMRAIRGRAHAMMDRILADHSSNMLGQVRNRAQLDDIVRELFGENTGNHAARELADAWGRSSDMLRQRFNAAGGDIGKMERWGLPQSHDSELVRAAGYDAWRAEILPRLDRQRMIDPDSGAVLTDDGLEEALRAVFETIRTDGWAGRKPGAAGQGAMANRRADARFLHFKSADDWMAYAARFGAGSPFDAMMGHIDGMSRDIAMMEIFGPNPTATVGWLQDMIERSAAMDKSADTKALQRTHAGNKAMQRMFAELNGDLQRPENRRLALVFSSLRSIQTAAKLGGAFLSAVTDTAFQYTTRRFNGIPAAGMLRDYAKLFRPGSIEDQKLAVRLGLIAEEWSNRTATQNRFLNEEMTSEVSRRLAEGVLRASGLSRWTQAGRWAFGMEFLGHITDMRGRAFGNLDPQFRAMMERNGITEADWNAIRATPVEADRGVDWIKPENVADARLGDRLLEMIARETDMAVPVADLRTRALMHAMAPSGTWQGEILKSALLFKSFGISMMIQQGGRILAMSGANRARYAAGLVISTTIMGAAAIWLKDLAAGRDPRAADRPEFWGQALGQGGGFGIFMDFLQSAENRAGSGLAETMAGPLVGDIQGAIDIAKAKHPGAKAIKEARDWLPGGTLWYARLAFDRMMTDQLMELADPNYAQSWKRMRRWADEQGTQYWWAPGDGAPDRAPDLSNITGQESMQ